MSEKLQYVPGRPVTGPGGKCPLCLENHTFQGEIIAETEHGFAGRIADDLVLICPREHLIGEPWGTAFAGDYFELLRLSSEVMRWENSSESRNKGHIAGQRLEHLHYKIQRRDAGQPASGWGTDALINKVNGTM